MSRRWQAALWVAVLALLVASERALERAAHAQKNPVPQFQVDPFWPKMPKGMILGQVSGVDVDAQDNVWITHRGSASLNNNEKGAELNPPIADCCRSAAPRGARASCGARGGTSSRRTSASSARARA